MTYNHAFDFAFEISGSTHPDGKDLTAKQIREHLIQKLATISDEELMENIGEPFDT